MGVDITTYRSRIGTFKHGNGIDVLTVECLVNFSGSLKAVGSVAFIGTLLIIAGVEPNPGPYPTDILVFVTALIALLLGIYISDKKGIDASWKTCLFISWTVVTVICMMASISRDPSMPTTTTTRTLKTSEEHDENNKINNEESSEGVKESAKTPLANQNFDQTAVGMLKELGLTDKYPGEIHISDLVTICPENINQTNNVRDLPLIFLKKIISANCDAMDLRCNSSDKEKVKQTSSVSALYDNSSEMENAGSICPLDLFILVFQCCDPMLKQIIFTKLYLCKMAIPFLHIDCLSKPSMSVWPLRSIAIEIESENGLCEESVLDLPMKIVSFARFGRPNMSKSKFLNRILSNTNTFFHKDSPCGTTPRFLTNGYVEMFFVPSTGGTQYTFDESVAVLNMRGDIKSAYENDTLVFLSKLSDLITIVCDIDSVLNNGTTLYETIVAFSVVILIIASPLDVNDVSTRASLFELEENILHRSKTKLHILCTYKRKYEKNITELVTEVSEKISEFLKTGSGIHLESLATRLKKCAKTAPSSDEGYECDEAKHEAYAVIKAMEKEAVVQETWLKVITPVQTLSCELSELLKQQYRCSKEFTKIETIKTKLRTVREQQLCQVSNSVRMFINCLVKNKNVSSMQYFLGWLHYFLEQKKRKVLPKLMQENHSAWDRYNEKKKEGKLTAEDLNKYEMSIKEIEGKIEKTSFGLDNLFRELGQICDAAILLDFEQKEAASNLPSIQLLADITAKLVCNGLTFELLDGSSFYMPHEWIKLVLGKVHKHIGGKKVLALSVLGVQSSGKSTLLNTMFGLQLSTSSGRCTKGIHTQLIPVKHTNKKAFEYVLVIDTEGLRAPELSDRNYQRDNELSTIITGLGDITLLNVMGENCIEIRDILQIIVHALLRLTLANQKLDICKSCVFIHQNVTDISARDKMKTGLQLLVRNLDTATKESAESEGISDITTFNQVIEFDTETNVWYLPNLWLGNPPMARVNRKYSEKVVDIKLNLIERALNDRHKSFKTLDDIVVHTEDLWKGVLAEDFVFSFRNSLEKKAYIELEKKVKEEIRNLDSSLDDTVYQLAHNAFSQCDDQESLLESKERIVLQMKRLVAQKGEISKSNLEGFFKNNNYKDIIIKWKVQTLNKLKMYCEEVIEKKKVEIDRLLSRREVDIMITLMHSKHEEELRKKSIELANELKGKDIGQRETEEKFEQIWKIFLNECVSLNALKKTDISLRDVFINSLIDIFGNHPVLFRVLDMHKMLEEKLDIHCLSGSFHITGIDEKDISIISTVRKFAKKIPGLRKFETSFKISRDTMENVFQSLDVKINSICRRDKEITSRDIKCFLNHVQIRFDNVQALHADIFTLKTSYVVKSFVHVSSFACSRFEAGNITYQNSHGINARLARYKSQVKVRFYAHLNDRKAEETAAELLRHAFEGFVRETVKDSMSVKVKSYLRGKLPIMKYQLILDILTELVERKSFDSFRKYIQTPKIYADSWITERAESILFLPCHRRYFDIAEIEINKCFEDINFSISKVAETLCPDSFLSINGWIKHFMKHLNKYKFPKEIFRDVIREQDRFEHLHSKHFDENLRKELVKSKVALLDAFKCETKESVCWGGLNPIDEICEDLWGCEEQCIFCGEPCIRNDRHESTNHICLQHRPSGCNGVSEENTELIWLRSCNYDVTSECNPKCSFFRYLCNPEGKCACSAERHPLKKYRDLLPNWDIEPTTDMEERSQFWMWFIGQYKSDIGNYYGIDVSNVPSRWGKITKKQALSSLRELYAKDSKKI